MICKKKRDTFDIRKCETNLRLSYQIWGDIRKFVSPIYKLCAILKNHLNKINLIKNEKNNFNDSITFDIRSNWVFAKS